jgi:hypothetical protein
VDNEEEDRTELNAREPHRKFQVDKDSRVLQKNRRSQMTRLGVDIWGEDSGIGRTMMVVDEEGEEDGKPRNGCSGRVKTVKQVIHEMLQTIHQTPACNNAISIPEKKAGILTVNPENLGRRRKQS